MATATITVHALCYMAVPDGSTVTITGVLYSAIAMADRTFNPWVSLMSLPQGSGTQRAFMLVAIASPKTARSKQSNIAET